MTTVEETSTSQPRDYSNKPPQRQRRKSRRRGGGDGGNKASQWDTTVNLPEIDDTIASIDIAELQSLPRNTLIKIAEETNNNKHVPSDENYELDWWKWPKSELIGGENLVNNSPCRAGTKICNKFQVIRRHGGVRVICENPKHKQRQG